MSSNPFDVAEQLYKKNQPTQKTASPFDIAEKQFKETQQPGPEYFEGLGNDVERDIERNQSRSLLRTGEAAVGAPGDIASFLTGLFGSEQNILPTSETLRKGSEKAFGEYVQPQNELEKTGDEFFSDIGSMLLPGAGHYSIARNIGIPLAGTAVKEGLKVSGADEKSEVAAKIGAMTILDLISHRRNLGTARQYASQLFQKADEAIPKGLSINSSQLEKSLTDLEKSLKMGGTRPDTGDALQKISELRGEIKNGKIDLKDLTAYRPSINSWIDKYKGFDIQAPPKVRKQIIHNLNRVKGEVINAAEEYGKKYNPEYLKLSQNANEAWGAIENSNKIAKFVEKHGASKIASNTLKGLLGIGVPGAVAGVTGLAAGAIPAAGALATSYPAYRALQTILRAKSPTLRKHYLGILKGASKGNVGQFTKNLNSLDKSLLEMEKTGELETD